MNKRYFSSILAALLAFTLSISSVFSYASQTGSRPAVSIEERKHAKISVDFQGVHIRSALMKISELSGLSIVLDEAVMPAELKQIPGERESPGPLESRRTEIDAPYRRTRTGREERTLPGGLSPRVTISLEDVPAIGALDAILRMKNLAYQFHGNIIIITSRERIFSERLETRMYILKSPVSGTVEFKMPDFTGDERDSERARLRIPGGD